MDCTDRDVIGFIGCAKTFSEDNCVELFMAVQAENDRVLFEKKIHELSEILHGSCISLELLEMKDKFFDESDRMIRDREKVALCVEALQ